MRILIVSNLYPPHYVGGYEIRCAQVAEELQKAGHEVHVVTSVYGLPGGTPDRSIVCGVPVERCLGQYAFPRSRTPRPWAFFHAREELRDARELRRVTEEFRPDLVNWWSMYGLSKLLLPLPRQWGIPDVHWIEHWWMIDEYGRDGASPAAFWTAVWDGHWGPRALRLCLRALCHVWEARIRREGLPTRSFSCTPTHVVFVSDFMAQIHHDAGFRFPSSEIIFGGVPTAQFYAPVRYRADSEKLRLLYAGQISPDRGLHTVIEALAAMSPDLRARFTLDVAGVGQAEYIARIQAEVTQSGLTDCVSFIGKVPHERMPTLYRQHDVLVFASGRREGLPLTMVEAMLSGCAVLTTGAGGAREIAELAMLPMFPEGDAAALRTALRQLDTDRDELHRIASRGQTVGLEEFSVERMMARYVRTLERLCGEYPRKSVREMKAGTGPAGV
jgi:glycosyltransferase involved in cell wall biosynthesis